MSVGGFFPAINPNASSGTSGVGQAGRNNKPDDIAEELKAVFPHGVMGILGKNFMKSALGMAGDPSNANPRSASGGFADDLVEAGQKARPSTLERSHSGNAGSQGGQSEQRPPTGARGQDAGADRSPSRHEMLAARRERAAEIARQGEQREQRDNVVPGTGGAFRGVLNPRAPTAGSVTARSLAKAALLDQQQAGQATARTLPQPTSTEPRPTRADGRPDGAGPIATRTARTPPR